LNSAVGVVAVQSSAPWRRCRSVVPLPSLMLRGLQSSLGSLRSGNSASQEDAPSVELHLGQTRSRGAPDEGPGLICERLDASPLAHDDLELKPSAARIASGQRDHLGAVRFDRSDLGAVVLYPAVARDDHPSLLGDDRDPDVIWRRRLVDLTRRAEPLVDQGARIAWVRCVRPECGDDLGQAKNVRVERTGRWPAYGPSRRAAGHLIRGGPADVGDVELKGGRNLLKALAFFQVLPEHLGADALDHWTPEANLRVDPNR